MRYGLIITAVFSSLFLFTACERRPQPPQAGPPNVVCVAAEKCDVANFREFVGQTVSESAVTIVPMVKGYLVKQNFDEGTMVKKGDLLFEIDPRPFEAQVQNAEGQLQAAQAQLINANIEYKRYSTLLREDATSAKDHDKVTMDKGSAEGQILIAKAALETAKINLEYTKLRAPFDGKLGVCPINVGNLVGPGTTNTKLSSIMCVDPMKVEFSVPETIFADVIEKYGDFDKASRAVIVKLTLPNGSPYKHEGSVYFSDNQVTAETGTIKMRARFPNPNSVLTANEYVRVVVMRKNKIPAILIPQTAVVEDMTGTVAMVVKDSKVERRAIKVGSTFGHKVEVLSGVAAGEWVVTEGLIKIRNGMSVNAKLAAGEKP